MKEKLAIVFPGQGSQKVGMLDSYKATNPDIVNDACIEASDTLGYDMATLIALDPNQQLNQTIFTQAAMLTAGVIAWRIRQASGAKAASILAGHSLGEYTALVCADAIPFATALKLVTKRAELMQSAVAKGTGAMAAIIGLELAQINAVCTEIGGVWPANINAPGQIVVAGLVNSVTLATEKAKGLGAKRAIILPVSVPSHCELMGVIASEFLGYLTEVKWCKTSIPVVHNYDVGIHNDADSLCHVLAQQLSNPVRWIETIEYFISAGVTEIEECGPGNVLTGLNKRIAPQLGAVVC